MSLGCERPGVQLQSPKRTTLGWVAAGRSRRCRTFSRVGLAIAPTLCQQPLKMWTTMVQKSQSSHPPRTLNWMTKSLTPKNLTKLRQALHQPRSRHQRLHQEHATGEERRSHRRCWLADAAVRAKAIAGATTQWEDLDLIAYGIQILIHLI